MRGVRLLVAVVAVVATAGLAGCGGDKATTMPDVTGKPLDDAKRAIKDAGVDDEVKVDGGGLFGVVVESNWEVCEQQPAAGTTVAGEATLTVARSCVADKSSEEPAATPAETAPPETVSTTPAVTAPTTPAETAPTTPAETAPGGPQAPATLTPQNNKDLAALLVVDDSCDDKSAAFAKKYAGQTIAFDGSIGDVAPAGKTRHYILIVPGDKGPNTTEGPTFQFRDVNTFDLHIEDRSAYLPAQGEKFRFIAEVGEFNQAQCLFFLKPVKTIPR